MTRSALDGLPVLGICGWSGSGKTTLIESLVASLAADGLRPAVLKHDAHGVSVDPPGTDSDGLSGRARRCSSSAPGESLGRRRHLAGDPATAIAELADRGDIVLVEGHKRLPIPKVWLRDRDGRGPPAEVGEVLADLRREDDRLSIVLPIVREVLRRRWLETPLWGCVLIGGRSARMGSPKHLLPEIDPAGGGREPRTWLDRTVEVLGATCGRIVAAGAGLLPPSLGGLPRLEDAPGVPGPMAGVLAALRWAPRVCWIVAACDLPWLSREAVEWIARERRPGAWAAIPVLGDGPRTEPLLAAYDFRARVIIEEAAARGEFSLAALASRPEFRRIPVPAGLAPAWRDADLPGDLAGLDPSSRSRPVAPREEGATEGGHRPRIGRRQKLEAGLARDQPPQHGVEGDAPAEEDRAPGPHPPDHGRRARGDRSYDPERELVARRARGRRGRPPPTRRRPCTARSASRGDGSLGAAHEVRHRVGRGRPPSTSRKRPVPAAQRSFISNLPTPPSGVEAHDLRVLAADVEDGVRAVGRDAAGAEGHGADLRDRPAAPVAG